MPPLAHRRPHGGKREQDCLRDFSVMHSIVVQESVWTNLKTNKDIVWIVPARDSCYTEFPVKESSEEGGDLRVSIVESHQDCTKLKDGNQEMVSA
jgi:hypothetical protein